MKQQSHFLSLIKEGLTLLVCSQNHPGPGSCHQSW